MNAEADGFSHGIKKYRWFIIGLAFVGIIINYLDRGALAYAITPIQSSFHLNNADFGLIASAFGIGYMLMTLIGGVLVDKFGAHKIWSASGFLWSLVTIVFGLISGFWAFFTLRLLLGIAEGPSFPALTRVVADWLPQSKRARALGISLAAVPFASVIGAPLVSLLIVNFNWRIMFLALGCMGITWTLAWYRFFSDSPVESVHLSSEDLIHLKKSQTKKRQSASTTSWRFMLLNPALLANNYAFFSFGYLLFFALTWLPGYFEQTYHLSLTHIALFLILPWLLGTVLILLGGFISDCIFQRTNSLRASRTHLIWISQVLSAACFLPVIFYHSLTIAIVFISLAVGLGLMPNAAFYAINADLAKDRAATSLGIMDCGFALAGILAPALTGLLSHAFNGFNAAIGLLIGLTFSSALCVFFFQHSDRYRLATTPASDLEKN